MTWTAIVSEHRMHVCELGRPLISLSMLHRCMLEVAARYRGLLVLTTLSFLILVRIANPFWEDYLANRAFVELVDYFLSPSASPADPRLALASELFDQLSLKFPARYQVYSDRLGGIKARLAGVPYHQYYAGRMYLQDAQEARGREDWDVAREYYRSAIAHGSEQIKFEAYLLLGDLLLLQGDQVGYREMMEVAYRFVPEMAVDFTGCAQMRLIGVFVDEQDLELNLPVHLVFVWEYVGEKNVSELAQAANEHTLEAREQHLFFWRDRVFQFEVVENLVPDGGFEQQILPQIAPLRQLPEDLYRGQEPDHANLSYEFAQRKQNMLLTLDGQGQNSVGLGSTKVDVLFDEQSIGYLVTGMYRTEENAVPRIGVRWWLKNADSWDENISSYAIKQPATTWTRFARLLIPPAGTDQLQLWVLNANESSALQADNLGLFRVPLPCVME